MTRHIALGNGTLLINIDKWLQIRDLYYPHVGQENHILGNACRIGIAEGGKAHWINEDGWIRELSYEKNTLVTKNIARNPNLAIEIKLTEAVHHKHDIFLRQITVKNNSNFERELTLLFHHDINLYGDGIGDTAGYDPVNNAVFHYKRKRYLYISSKDKIGYTAGTNPDSWIDCQDGILNKNPIAQGKVDSAISIRLRVPAKAKKKTSYWIACGRDFSDAIKKNDIVREKGISKLIEETREHWKKSLKPIKLAGLDKNSRDLYQRCILTIRTQMDNYGAIIAANDSDNIRFNKDTYSYMWPRDAALVAMALQRAGYSEITRELYFFCEKILSEAGCFLHKYNPDGSLGSSWHPYIEDGKPQLPIQEDSTALILAAIHDNYKRTRDKKLLYKLYLPLIKPMAEFLYNYRYKDTKLPQESYDLWEERRGIFTFTCNSVCLGLLSASKMAKAMKDPAHKKYQKAREEVHNSVVKILYSEKDKRFIRGIIAKDKSKDATIESSLASTFLFCGLDADDEMVSNTMSAIENNLSFAGGIARYKNDQYYAENGKSNPWIICTTWVGRWKIAKAKTLEELREAKKYIDWIINSALETGILPEQIGAESKKPLSVAPLTWSCASYINLALDYSEKFESLAKKAKSAKKASKRR
ncbi:glycoside hydrolase family 15 protein [Candidatus Woesearchaeota archaeon]|nr:MAG: glycoside hydrolase family 15 protein [Candidatus Woesearchaeota archaeon]